MNWPILLRDAALLSPVSVLAQVSNNYGDSAIPLQSDRAIAIDTTEGSWISLDVIHDRQIIVFEHLGDILMVPITGGERGGSVPNRRAERCRPGPDR